jgi:hypothetical protein
MFPMLQNGCPKSSMQSMQALILVIELGGRCDLDPVEAHIKVAAAPATCHTHVSNLNLEQTVWQ